MTTCSSSDPEVSKYLYADGDCSADIWKVTVRWGDHSRPEDFTTSGPSGPSHPKFLAAHSYAQRGSYTITVTGKDTSGNCTFDDSTYTFRLKPISASLSLAALGDSYSSGEGTGEYYTDSGQCHRSPDAWPRLLGIANPHAELAHEDFLACSGADSTALTDKAFKGQRPQLPVLRGLRPKPTLVTLTMGGNDVGFKDILADCFHKQCIRDGTIKKATADVHKEESTLAADYKQLIAADPNATILVVGYPKIFVSDHYCGIKWLGLGFKPAELDALNKLGAEFNDIIADAAAKAGLTYIDVTDALHGHEMCSKHPWVVQVDLAGLWNQEEGHPTIPCQKAIETFVRNYMTDKL